MTVDVCGTLHLPQRQGDVGYDLASVEEALVHVGGFRFVRTGVRLAMPEGIWCEIVGRSSALAKHGLLVVHSIIDTGYTGELTFGVINMSDRSARIPVGMRIAQVIFRRAVCPDIRQVSCMPVTERGAQGFGSTGT